MKRKWTKDFDYKEKSKQRKFHAVVSCRWLIDNLSSGFVNWIKLLLISITDLDLPFTFVIRIQVKKMAAVKEFF